MLLWEKILRGASDETDAQSRARRDSSEHGRAIEDGRGDHRPLALRERQSRDRALGRRARPRASRRRSRAAMPAADRQGRDADGRCRAAAWARSAATRRGCGRRSTSCSRTRSASTERRRDDPRARRRAATRACRSVVADTGRGIAAGAAAAHLRRRSRASTEPALAGAGRPGPGAGGRVAAGRAPRRHGGRRQRRRGARVDVHDHAAARRCGGGPGVRDRRAVRRRPAWNAGGARPRARRRMLKGLRVLVVDDEPRVREAITLVLRDAGSKVTTASSAAEAFAALRDGRWDAIVSDIGMPEEDGYSLIRRVRGLPADGGRGVGAVALTGCARPQDQSRAIEAGFNLHLTKPVEASDLIRAVATVAARPRAAATTPRARRQPEPFLDRRATAMSASPYSPRASHVQRWLFVVGFVVTPRRVDAGACARRPAPRATWCGVRRLLIRKESSNMQRLHLTRSLLLPTRGRRCLPRLGVWPPRRRRQQRQSAARAAPAYGGDNGGVGGNGGVAGSGAGGTGNVMVIGPDAGAAGMVTKMSCPSATSDPLPYTERLHAGSRRSTRWRCRWRTRSPTPRSSSR